MDDLVGIQKPLRRLTEAAEAVAELERAVPGLAALRFAVPLDLDWTRLEANLGLALPADYKLLCELFPAFELGNFMAFGGPDPGHEHLWLKGAREELEIIDEWLGYADLTVPMHTYPAPGGLLPWSTSNEGDIFLWSTGGEGPEEWTVTVASRNGDWWHYEGGVAQFMADLVGGRLELWGLPSVSCEVNAR
ncbi:SMI1/KNR4 family protein [Streptomyces sp. Ag109_O5-1]|uniref:SMI1/KNR4 family protein n=1 Tax=Streptomyces sp. Ag109_O5-1 TaxID=1938851 RepID=UPI000F4D4E70|nr:SMI1/KNR4 family protein [Streptomyces sp. Ag109_O5-1]